MITANSYNRNSIRINYFQIHTTYRVAANSENTTNLIYLFLCDRYKKIIHIIWKPYLLAFKRSTLYFGTLHTIREISIFVKEMRSHFVRLLFYEKTKVSLHVWFSFSHKAFGYSKPPINKLGQKRPKKGQWRPKKGLKGQIRL